jgi:hypothetical protein
MSMDNYLDAVPQAVAAIIGPNLTFLITVNATAEDRQKAVLDLTYKVTRTLVCAMREVERPKFNASGDVED